MPISIQSNEVQCVFGSGDIIISAAHEYGCVENEVVLSIGPVQLALNTPPSLASTPMNL